MFAAEPKGADDAARSKAAGQRLPQTDPRTIADGLRTSLGDLTWPIVRDRVERVITVTEEEIIAAMRLLVGAGQAAGRAELRGRLRRRPDRRVPRHPGLGRVGIVLSGGNVDLDHLPW